MRKRNYELNERTRTLESRGRQLKTWAEERGIHGDWQIICKDTEDATSVFFDFDIPDASLFLVTDSQQDGLALFQWVGANGEEKITECLYADDYSRETWLECMAVVVGRATSAYSGAPLEQREEEGRAGKGEAEVAS
jgi:hypothetical protein